jgi:hypothetical protein
VLQELISITPTLARRIEIWPVGRLVPYARNARTHSEAQGVQIAASIAEFGFNAPILVDSNAGIVAGHGRRLAARKLGLLEVPLVVPDHLTENRFKNAREPIFRFCRQPEIEFRPKAVGHGIASTTRSPTRNRPSGVGY